MLRRIALGALVLATTTEARADKEEASLHFELIGGIARIGDAAAPGTSSTAPLGGVATRFGYGLADWYQVDAELTLAATATAHYDRGDFTTPGGTITGPFSITEQLARVDAGITFRFGVRFIPTFRFALGAEARRAGTPSGFSGAVRDPLLNADLTARATAGLDVRLSARVVVGASVDATYALPLGGSSFETLDLTVSYTRMWYPRW